MLAFFRRDTALWYFFHYGVRRLVMCLLTLAPVDQALHYLSVGFIPKKKAFSRLGIVLIIVVFIDRRTVEVSGSNIVTETDHGVELMLGCRTWTTPINGIFILDNIPPEYFMSFLISYILTKIYFGRPCYRRVADSYRVRFSTSSWIRVCIILQSLPLLDKIYASLIDLHETTSFPL